MNKHLILSFVLATAVVNAMAQADAEWQDSTYTSEQLKEFVVTGTLTPKLLADTPVQTLLITPREIQQSGASNIRELLTTVLPGVEFSYSMNQQVNLNLSGFSGQNILVLVDGERLAGETIDNVDFERLIMDNVERVEIIKGAASAIYGSNASGGVINIITKKQTKKWNATVTGRIATHNEYRVGLNAGFRAGKFSNTISLTRSGIDTYTVCRDFSDQCDFRKVYGGKTFNISDRLTWEPSHNLKISGRAGYYFRERLYNPDTPDRYRDFTGGVRANWQITDIDKLELSYSFDQYDKSDYLGDLGLDIRDYSNSRHNVHALYTHSFSAQKLLTVGGDLSRDYLMTYQFSDNGSKKQYTADIFGQYDWTINELWEVVGATRWDYYSDGHKSQFVAKANARYRIPAINLTLRGGYAGGFRAPSLKEKYMEFDMSGIFDIHGNPDLKAEKSHNFNFSAEYSHAPFNATMGASYNLVDDKISTSSIYYTEQGAPYIRYINLKNMRVVTFDASIQARFTNGISARAGYNYTHEQSVGSTVNQYCPARPHSLNLRTDWTRSFSKNFDFNIALTGRVLSAVSYESMIMYEPFEKITITNPAYTLWNIQATATILNGISLTFAVDNIFNYAPKVYYYNSPVTLGTNFIATLRVDIDRFFN